MSGLFSYVKDRKELNLHMSENNELQIVTSISFDPKESQGNLEQTLGKLQSNDKNKLNLGMDFGGISTQIDNLSKQLDKLSNKPIKFKPEVDTNGLKTVKTTVEEEIKLLKELEKISKNVANQTGTTSNVTIDKDKLGNIKQAVVSYTNEVGKSRKETYKLFETINENGEKVKSFELFGEKFTNNTEKARKDVEKLKNQLQELKKTYLELNKGSTTYSDMTRFKDAQKQLSRASESGFTTNDGRDKVTQSIEYFKQKNEEVKRSLMSQKELYDELDNLQKQSFNLKERMIGKDEQTKVLLQEQLDIIKQQQLEIAKTTSEKGFINNDRRNQYSDNGKTFQSNLDIKTNTEAQRIASVQDSIQTKTKQFTDKMNLQMKELSRNYKDFLPEDKVQEFNSSLEQLSRKDFKNMKELNKETQEIQMKMAQMSQQAKEDRSKSFLADLKHNLGKFTEFLMAGTIFMQVNKFFQDGIKYATELDKKLTEVAIVTGNMDFKGMGDQFSKMAKELSSSQMDIATASVEFYRQGLSQVEVMNRVAETTKYAKVSNLEFKQSAEILTATVNSMNIPIQKASDVFTYLGRICPLI